jgi:hypothetical protein
MGGGGHGRDDDDWTDSTMTQAMDAPTPTDQVNPAAGAPGGSGAQRGPAASGDAVRKSFLARKVELARTRARNWGTLFGYWRKVGATRMLTLLRIIEYDFGHLLSMAHGSVDAKGDPIPWLTYPAVEYLSQFDYGDADVFEYGGGNSTKWWASRAKWVTTVEDDPGWFGELERAVRPNQTLFLEREPAAYAQAVLRQGKAYDVISIDGVHRNLCAQSAVKALKPTGFIVLDNSDWYPKTTAFLRSLDLIQVDFFGLGPIVNFHTATSIFLKRGAVLRPKQSVQPCHAIAGLKQVVDPE